MLNEARVAELVDAADSKSAEGNLVGVRFPSRVLNRRQKTLVNYCFTGVLSFYQI